MNALFGAVIALIGCGGIWLAIAGWRGVREPQRTSRSLDLKDLWWRFGLAAVLFGFVWIITGWPMAGASVAGVAVMVPVFVTARSQRDEALAKADALATWAEMLRDTIASHAGLRQAIILTASVAPREIGDELRRLSVRCDRMSLPDALRLFAAETDDSVGDMIVAALVIAEQHQAQNLTELLSGIARSARQQSSMRRRIETGRARTYASSKWIVVLTFGLAVGLVAFSRDFLEPYDDFGGQVALGFVGALFAGAVWSLISLSRPVPQPRLLAGIETVVS